MIVNPYADLKIRKNPYAITEYLRLNDYVIRKIGPWKSREIIVKNIDMEEINGLCIPIIKLSLYKNVDRLELIETFVVHPETKKLQDFQFYDFRSRLYRDLFRNRDCPITGTLAIKATRLFTPLLNMKRKYRIHISLI